MESGLSAVAQSILVRRSITSTDNLVCLVEMELYEFSWRCAVGQAPRDWPHPLSGMFRTLGKPGKSLTKQPFSDKKSRQLFANQHVNVSFDAIEGNQVDWSFPLRSGMGAHFAHSWCRGGPCVLWRSLNFNHASRHVRFWFLGRLSRGMPAGGLRGA